MEEIYAGNASDAAAQVEPFMHKYARYIFNLPTQQAAPITVEHVQAAFTK